MIKLFRTLVLYPFFVGILPIFVLMTGNLNIINFSMVVRSFIVTILITGILFILLHLFLHDWNKAGLAVTFFVIFFLYFFRFTSLLNNLFTVFQVNQVQIPAAIVASIMILCLWAIIRIIRKPEVFTLPLNFIATSMILINISTIGLYNLRQQMQNPVKQDELSTFMVDPGSASSQESKRDIYYIIFDEYNRSDVLQELYALDNQSFLDSLTAKGFYVADKSQSNYSQTVLSLSSSLNMQYLDQLIALDPNSDNRNPLVHLLANSQMRRFLESQGYQIVAFDTGYYGTNITDADIFISRKNAINMFEYLLINNSLAFPVLDAISKPLQYDGMIEQFNKLDELVNLFGPKFVFAHFVIPHPPFLIDRFGNMQKKFSGAISDGNYFKGSNEDYQEGYREQVLYVNQRIEQIIDHILSSSGPQPIIIIQGDHGSGLFLDNDSMAATCTRERFSILNAYYLPGIEDAHLYPGITPVNSFRLVLNAYFDTDLPLLEDDSYFSTLGKPFDYQVVSKDQLTQSCEP